MTEIMAVRTGRNVQRSALRCNRNTSGYAAALPISSCKLMEEHGPDCRAWHGRPARDLIDHRLEADATTDAAQRPSADMRTRRRR
jgi:hypothetical protein